MDNFNFYGIFTLFHKKYLKFCGCISNIVLYIRFHGE